MAATGSLRLLIETSEGGNAGELALRNAVGALSGAGVWHVERLFPGDDLDDRSFIVSTDPRVPMTPQQAFQLAYRLEADPGITDVEPDLPVPAYAPEEEQAPPPGAFEAPPPSPEQLAWALTAIRGQDAWGLAPKAGGASRGAGVRIGHPDTGYTRHPAFGPQLDALDLVHDRDFVGDDDNALDPLERSSVPLAKFPGHGTGTASVIVGRGGQQGVLGVAPMATLVPLRAVNSVVQFFDSDVARAVGYARQADCHVVSMSLGGKGFFGLHRAIDRALDAGMIVLAAAGNYVHLVTAPASYGNCIAVAAIGEDDLPWKGSSRGKDVEISAPGSRLWGAAWRLDVEPRVPFVSVKHGTSFAVAHVAGAAALWLAYHGRSSLVARYPGRRLQAAFLHLLRTAGHRRPAVWDDDLYRSFGVGIVDARALLEAPLPDPATLDDQVGAFPEQPPAGLVRVAAAFGELDEGAVAARLVVLRLDQDDVDRFAPELLYHLLTDLPAAAAFVAADPGAGAFESVWVQRLHAHASTSLAGAIAT
ncbi:MAG: S8 family peptidase [Acidimicrobiales bacterium]